jgi:hypothetical protein
MSTDQRGLATSGSPEAVASLDRAVDHLIRFQIEVVEEAAKAGASDPTCVMGIVLRAYLSLMSTEGSNVQEAQDALRALSMAETDLLPRERAHLEAANRWVARDMAGAGASLDEISVEHPRDLLALAVGHQIDFFTGNARNLRDRIGRALYAWGPDDPQLGFVQGMYAFGLEECNLYGLSEEIGQESVDANADDVWGIHAVVHTYEMQGQIPEGIRFMQSRETDWATGNFLNVHNSWHYALYLLEGGDVSAALDVYDRVLHHEESQDVALELLDATALLWRLYLEDTSVGERWQPLAEAWARSLSPGFYPFNDMHATMAFVGSGDLVRAHELVSDLEHLVETGDQRTTSWLMTANVGLPVCRSIVQFGTGEYRLVVDELLPRRGTFHEFGGSHAQRDAIERTLLEAAIRGRLNDIALALVSERLGVRENSSYAWWKRAQVLSDTAKSAESGSAKARAESLAASIRGGPMTSQ